jgi:hypothetical protein
VSLPGPEPTLTPSPDRVLNRVAAAGLLVGAGFGLAGTLVASPPLQASLWAIDSVGLVVATCLLTVKYSRAGADIVAAGFLVFAIGEGVLLSGTAAGSRESVPAFAAGTALWAAGLVLISVPPLLARSLRLLGGVAAGLFAVTAGRIYAGEALVPTATPLPLLRLPVSGRDPAGMGLDARAGAVRRSVQIVRQTRQEHVMNFRTLPWYPIAVVLGGINLAAAGFAGGAAEPWHATVHVALAVACGAWARRLRRGPGDGEHQERLELLEAELSSLRGELSETQERLDFAERLLAQGAESRRVGPER